MFAPATVRDNSAVFIQNTYLHCNTCRHGRTFGPAESLRSTTRARAVVRWARAIMRGRIAARSCELIHFCLPHRLRPMETVDGPGQSPELGPHREALAPRRPDHDGYRRRWRGFDGSCAATRLRSWTRR